MVVPGPAFSRQARGGVYVASSATAPRGAIPMREDCAPPRQTSGFDTSAAVRLRSPLSTVPAGILSRRFRNAHHHGFCPQQLAVAWDQHLITEPEGGLLHLSYSCTSPRRLAMLVTQDPKRNCASQIEF